MFRWIVAGWLVVGSTMLMTGPALAQDSSSSDQDERIPGVVYYEDPSVQHSMDPVDYEMDPPAGGEHHPVWQNCGFYDEFIVPEHAVHSQEHGAVWITFDPNLDDEQIAALQQLTTENSYLLVTPYSSRQDRPCCASRRRRPGRLAWEPTTVRSCRCCRSRGGSPLGDHPVRAPGAA